MSQEALKTLGTRPTSMGALSRLSMETTSTRLSAWWPCLSRPSGLDRSRSLREATSSSATFAPVDACPRVATCAKLVPLKTPPSPERAKAPSETWPPLVIEAAVEPKESSRSVTGLLDRTSSSKSVEASSARSTPKPSCPICLRQATP